MADLWQDKSFDSGSALNQAFDSADDWDEGEESLETDVEDGLEDAEELEDEESWDGADDEVTPQPRV
jgi:hypothetical protein